MDQITHDVRGSQWLEIITQCQNRPEGTTAKQWMADNGINEKSYYYWLRKFRKQAYSQMNPPSTVVYGTLSVGCSFPLFCQQEMCVLIRWIICFVNVR